ncbi:MAG: HAD-IIB family hydrolase [Ruminococcaceae bacterium]|nr:HAD-IIB family hydrolase [Oscillospiraceae bacterium]
MGRYSGFLICSDFDGTLFDGERIPENNLEAIREFRREGGLFTIVSGRDVGTLPNIYDGYRFGVPIVHANGAVIYDIDNGKIVRESYMSGFTKELALSYAEAAEIYENLILFPKKGLLRIPKKDGHLLTEELCENTHKFIIELRQGVSKEESDAVYSRIRRSVGDRFIVVRSSYRLIEVLDKSLTKASAALFLKEYTNSHTLVCVGDFENDIDMIKAADIGYAVGNATETVKLAADRITVSVKDGAIAKIISEL